MWGATAKIFLLLFGLWIAVMAVALPLASLPEEAAGRVVVAFPPGLSAEARLLAVAEAGGSPVLPLLGGRLWMAEGDGAGFVGRLKAAGAWAAFRPETFAVLPDGGCFYISVRKPGPPQPHPPI